MSSRDTPHPVNVGDDDHGRVRVDLAPSGPIRITCTDTSLDERSLKVYLTAWITPTDARELAAALIEHADWQEARS